MKLDETAIIKEAMGLYADYLHKNEQCMGVDEVDVPRSTRAAIKAIVRAINEAIKNDVPSFASTGPR